MLWNIQTRIGPKIRKIFAPIVQRSNSILIIFSYSIVSHFETNLNNFSALFSNIFVTRIRTFFWRKNISLNSFVRFSETIYFALRKFQQLIFLQYRLVEYAWKLYMEFPTKFYFIYQRARRLFIILANSISIDFIPWNISSKRFTLN